MSFKVKCIIALCAIVFIVFCAIKATHKPSVPFGQEGLNSDEVLPEGDFITKGNWTIFSFKFTYSSFFNPDSVPKILDRFEKEHLKLRIEDWGIIYNQTSSHPYGILFRHYPISSEQIK